ncbi:MAG: sterol desaturase/sphingolipid hydroxylase (fatty acid hydroxylase superfamily) [Candidatus Endobugula sp.]|jgi:sterol desaturase/sphingolipid hydroxylase (fatty acid hydroxylase superfamily)
MDFLINYKIIIAIACFALFFVGERLFSSAPYPAYFTASIKRARLFKNMSISAINMLLSPLLIIPLTAFITLYFASWRPEWMRSPIVLLIDIVILDGFLYWWHRLNHYLPVFWRFHEVHHLDEFLDSTTGLRFHFGEVFLSAIARALLIVALGMPIATVIIFEICILVFSIFNHSNLRILNRLEKILSLFIVTPAIHWLHHHAQRGDTDSNYATIFSFWDRLFGTQNNKQRWKDMPMGVEGRRELGLYKLLTRPLHK